MEEETRQSREQGRSLLLANFLSESVGRLSLLELVLLLVRFNSQSDQPG